MRHQYLRALAAVALASTPAIQPGSMAPASHI
jgi:hypothetical protein